MSPFYSYCYVRVLRKDHSLAQQTLAVHWIEPTFEFSSPSNNRLNPWTYSRPKVIRKFSRSLWLYWNASSKPDRLPLFPKIRNH